MSRRTPTTLTWLFALILVSGAGAWLSIAAARPGNSQGGSQAPAQPAAQFRSSAVVVPVEVRVVDDKTGKPVRDLTIDDFTLHEDGNLQPIRLFERRELVPEEVKSGVVETIPLRRTPFGISPVHNRVFLLVLGRGRLQEPSRALDALIRFVRERLLPQDQIAVFAYDRATKFTTDHESIAAFLERFRTRHYEIDMDVKLQVESGLSALYGSRTLPKKVQDKIDNLFLGAGTLESNRLKSVQPPGAQRAEADVQRQAEKLQLADINAVGATLASGFSGAPGGLGSWTSLDEVTNEQFAGISFDDYMQYTAQALMDLSNCFAGVEYLRHLEGEKHLVFVTEKGMYLPRMEDDMSLAQAASVAQVAIDTFQTGGLTPQMGGAVQNTWNETFAFKALRTIAEVSGGVSSITEKGDVAVDRIDDSSRAGYVLGFYPPPARIDGKYHQLEVKVKRPGVRVLYRHGYLAEREITPFDRRSFITNDRLLAALSFSREINDIRVKLHADLKRQPDGSTQVMIDASIDPSKLALQVVDGVRTGAIDVLVVCLNDKGAGLAQSYQRVTLKFTPDVWAQIAKSGIPYKAHLEVSPGVRQVRFIVYDYGSDLVGRQDASVL
jgi:VWFA-related protein